MDLFIIKGLVGLACFIQTNSGLDNNNIDMIKDSLPLEQAKFVESVENPCLIMPENIEAIIKKEDEGYEIILAGGEPTMSLSK